MLGFGVTGELPLGSLGNNLTPSQTLVPSFYTDSDTFYSEQINLILFASEFVNSNTFYTDVLTLYLTPSLFTNQNTFYTPKLSFILHPSYYEDSDSFYTADLTTGIVYLLPDLFINIAQFPPDVLIEYLLPPFVGNYSQYIASPTVKQTFKVSPSDFNHNIRPTIFKDGFLRKNPLRRGKKA